MPSSCARWPSWRRSGCTPPREKATPACGRTMTTRPSGSGPWHFPGGAGSYRWRRALRAKLRPASWRCSRVSASYAPFRGGLCVLARRLLPPKLLQPSHTLPSNAFPDVLALQTLLDKRLRRNAHSDIARLAQIVGLRVGCAFLAKASAGIGFADREKGLEAPFRTQGPGGAQQLEQGLAGQFTAAMDEQVVLAGGEGELSVGIGDLDSVAKGVDPPQAALFVTDVPRQLVSGSVGLAEIVQQGCPAHLASAGQACSLGQDHEGVHAAVDLGMVFCPLRHAKQRVDFREQRSESTTVAQHTKIGGGIIFA